MAGQKLLQISLLTELREPLNPEGDALYLEADSLASLLKLCVGPVCFECNRHHLDALRLWLSEVSQGCCLVPAWKSLSWQKVPRFSVLLLCSLILA